MFSNVSQTLKYKGITRRSQRSKIVVLVEKVNETMVL